MTFWLHFVKRFMKSSISSASLRWFGISPGTIYTFCYIHVFLFQWWVVCIWSFLYSYELHGW